MRQLFYLFHRHVRPFLHQRQHVSFVIAPLGFDDHSHDISLRFSEAEPFHFVGDQHIIPGFEPVGNFFEDVLVWSGEGYHGTFHSYTFEQDAEKLQSRQSEQGSGYTYYIHSGTDGQTDARGGPYSCRSGQSTYNLFLQDDGACTDKTDAADYLCLPAAWVQRYAVFLDDVLKAVLGNNHDEGTAQ